MSNSLDPDQDRCSGSTPNCLQKYHISFHYHLALLCTDSVKTAHNTRKRVMQDDKSLLTRKELKLGRPQVGIIYVLKAFFTHWVILP